MSKGVLVNLTKCIGCGSCTVACKMYNQNKWIEDRAPTSGEKAELADENWTVIQKCRFNAQNENIAVKAPAPKILPKDLVKNFIGIQNKEIPLGEVNWSGQSSDAVAGATKTDGTEVWRYVKHQCLHCKEPACASACFAKAFQKTEEGPVVYYPQLCVGCRYCMVACPFNIPKFEWDNPLPKVTKCMFCASKVERGEVPACVGVCPTGVMKFGDRDELLEEAKELIAKDEKLVKHIYGEEEAGGTEWIYISDKPFDQLGFKTHIPKKSIPGYTEKYMHWTPIFGAAWFAVLTCLYLITKPWNKKNGTGDTADKE